MIKLLFLVALTVNTEMPKDSIGIEVINGKTFVIHRVEEKETLFAISRRYRTTVDAIVQYNEGAREGLEIGQILKVPYTPPATAARPAGPLHKVQPGETLYSIARQYQVSTDDIKQWNSLADNTLSIGQELVIRKVTAARPQESAPRPLEVKGVHEVQPGQTLFSIARQYQVSVDQIRQWNSLTGNDLKVGQTLYVAQPDRRAPVSPANTPVPEAGRTETRPDRPAVSTTEPVTTPVTPPAVRNATQLPPNQSAESIRISESLKSGDEVIEKGLAELIDGTEGNRKYLALHRTAPIGTILKIRNEMNNREVFVRVMGKLPDTAMTDKLIIRISKSAYDRLGAIDPRFRVEVTYYR